MRFGRLFLAAAVAASVFATSTGAELLPEGVTEDSLSTSPTLVQLPAQPILFVQLKTVRNTQASTDLISGTFKRIWAFAKARRLTISGSPMEVMSRYEEEDGSWVLKAAIPVEMPAAGAYTHKDAGDIQLGSIGGGEAVQAAHRGAHERIKDTHGKIAAFLSARGLKAGGQIAEQHFDNPHIVPAEKLRSSVTFFLR